MSLWQGDHHRLLWDSISAPGPAASGHDHALAVDMSVEDIMTAMSTFDRMTAAEAMGLKRPPLLRSLLAADDSGGLKRALKQFVVNCALGNVPAEVLPYLCGACVSPLPRPDGGVRPVAAGEILRRLVAKVLPAKTTPEVAPKLDPLQLGVGVRCGTERIAHNTRRLMERERDNPDFVLFQAVAINCFNLIERSEIIARINQVPGLAMSVVCCYGGYTHLWAGLRRMWSRQGGQQGDPLLPLIFAVVLHTLVKKIEDLGLLLNKCYLDDGAIA